MKSALLISGLFVLLGLAPCLLAADTPAGQPAGPAPTPQYVPAQTTVAILPVVDESGAKDTDTDKSNVRTVLLEQFTNHGFVVIDDAKVQAAITDQKIDLTDDEQQKRETLYKIGSAVGANLVVFVVVTDKQQKEEDHFFDTARIGLAKVKVWLLDVDRQQPILSAKVFDGKDQGRYYTEHSGIYLAARATGNATENALKDFLTPYPLKKTDNK